MTCGGLAWSEESPPPVMIGLVAEFGLLDSTSAQAIEQGIRVAMAEINEQGGVLAGRPLALETRDDRSVPARGVHYLRELAAIPDMVAVFSGRFSPVVLEMSPIAHDLEVIVLVPWAAADPITQLDRHPHYIFRLSLQDRLAMTTMLNHIRAQGWQRVGLMLPNTGWGRSNYEAAQQQISAASDLSIVRSHWYNFGDTSLVEGYRGLVDSGAEVLLLVANDREAAILLQEISARPEVPRLPIVSHWGVTGGQFFTKAWEPLQEIDFSVVQSFSFFTTDPERRAQFMATFQQLYGITDWQRIPSVVGVAHAYDLTHLLAMAIDQAGSTDRAAIRDALEQLGQFEGLVKTYHQPFSPDDHDALDQDSVFMARFRDDGVLVPLP